MMEYASATKVYLACGGTDLCRSIDGLAALVSEAFALDPFAPCLFVLRNQQRDKIKILEWDHNSFWLYYPGLSGAAFAGPIRRKPRCPSVSGNCGGYSMVYHLSNVRPTPQ